MLHYHFFFPPPFFGGTFTAFFLAALGRTGAASSTFSAFGFAAGFFTIDFFTAAGFLALPFAALPPLVAFAILRTPGATSLNAAPLKYERRIVPSEEV